MRPASSVQELGCPSTGSPFYLLKAPVPAECLLHTLFFGLNLFNMKEIFLVHILLPDVFTEDFYALLPAQRKHINALMEQQVILSYTLDMERKNIWAFIYGENKTEIRAILEKFPIIHRVEFDIHELAFHDIANQSLSQLIMN
jgi:hypothetical protein